VEKFGWKFSAKDYSLPDRSGLSSAAMVTAAKTVQSARCRVADVIVFTEAVLELPANFFRPCLGWFVVFPIDPELAPRRKAQGKLWAAFF
jgi:hypothetical protein